ncbi:hypothetical protein [Streptosporangium sp. NPDC049644]|uniref:hypothetical protein n=1 Tax=Streptosporangium sp. NPDC049644 TaxID=3155507 RepID=UPI003442263D
MRKSGAAAVLGALSLFAAACGGTADSPSGGPAHGGTFSFAIGGDPGVLDPAMGVLSVTNTVLSLAYDTLTRVGPDSRIISHNLAVVRYVSDVVAVMHRGRPVEMGATEEVVGSPRDDYTRSLPEAVPRLGRARTT